MAGSTPMPIPSSKAHIPPPLPPPKHPDEFINRNPDDMAWMRTNNRNGSSSTTATTTTTTEKETIAAAVAAAAAAAAASEAGRHHLYGSSPPRYIFKQPIHSSNHRRSSSSQSSVSHTQQSIEPEGMSPLERLDGADMKHNRSTRANSDEHSPGVDEGYSSLSVSNPNLPRLIPREPFKVGSQQSMNLYDSSLLRKFNRVAPESGYSSINKVLNSPEFQPASLDEGDSPRRSSGLTAIKTTEIHSPVTSSPITDSPISKYPPMSLSPGAAQRQSQLTTDIAHSNEMKALAARDGVEMASQDEQSRLAIRSTRGSYPKMEIDSSMEETGLNLLSLRSQSSPKPIDQQLSPRQSHQTALQSQQYPRNDRKRRASSPPTEDGFQPRPAHGVSGNSPPRRIYPNNSVSSQGTAARTGSYASSGGWSVAAGSMSSASSYDVDMSAPSPYGPPPTALSPRNAYAAVPHHLRTLSESTVTPHDAYESALPERKLPRGVQRNYNAIMCECCPKKPKKFDTQEELKAHEAEKQFKCLYCHNRFKNKNEAERHQNSLHLRKHSWSCASLSSPEAAFPTSWQKGSVADVCGYCGEEFAVPADWQARMDHLVMVHKYNECNHQKKFFRADHFRQHLKHSHAGTSGKWTNMLEDACMRDEPLPEQMPEER